MKKKCDIGIIGLSVMGRNLALNIRDRGFQVGGYDKDEAQVTALLQESENQGIFAAKELEELIASLKSPRICLLLVPAGTIIDTLIDTLLPLLDKGDIVVDAGNSYYKDTTLRAKKCAEKGIHLIGMGVSGGEEGSRYGPSMMPGGPYEAYKHLAPIVEKAAAKVDDTPCVTYIGPGSSGHFVKMVHNGIEYGIMQLISECYDFMKRGAGYSDSDIQKVFAEWNEGASASYLVEITAAIFEKIDQKTKKHLIDVILDVAAQKGTGMWTSQSAMELGVPTPTIDIAVSVRNLSVREKERSRAQDLFEHKVSIWDSFDPNVLQKAFYAATSCVYAQGFCLLQTASSELHYSLDLEKIASIWRGGCIIRASFLEAIRKAYTNNPSLSNLIFDQGVKQVVQQNESHLRHVVTMGAKCALPIPAFMASLAYLDGLTSAWLPANLIQAERDFFGAHTYERVDEKGTFHTDWKRGDVL